MNFVTRLPRSLRCHNVIWVIINRLTKFAHFLLVNMKYTLKKLVKLYLDEIIKLHEVPVSIVSDRDFFICIPIVVANAKSVRHQIEI